MSFLGFTRALLWYENIILCPIYGVKSYVLCHLWCEKLCFMWCHEVGDAFALCFAGSGIFQLQRLLQDRASPLKIARFMMRL